MKVTYISLGCAKNQVDFENLIGELSSNGCEIEDDLTVSDAIVINTCGFIESAVKEAIDTIMDVASKKKPTAKLVVAGCMVERYKDDIKTELPEIDFFTGVYTLSDITDYLIADRDKNRVDFNDIEHRVITNHSYYAYLKISDGCDNKCSFCTIPKIRGKLKSKPIDKIVEETRILISKGVKEIIIISQDTTDYHYDIDKSKRLIELLDRLATEFNDTYFRLLYMNPDGVTAELIQFIKSKENIINYFDIPIQHINDRILKVMKRKSNQKIIRTVISNIKKYIPDAFIRSTFIVGFPSETDEEFNDLKEFIEEGNIDFAGFFEYSDEDIAVSYKYDDKVDKRVAKKRRAVLERAQKKCTSKRLRSLKSTIFDAYIETVSDQSDYILEGRALFQTPVVDGKLFTLDGVADKGFGPYKVKLKRVIYPDIYVEIL